MMRARRLRPMLAAAAAVLCLTLALEAGQATRPKFFDDDPLWVHPETQDASGVTPWTIDLLVDMTTNLLGKPGDAASGVRAQNVNTVDEVPDSSWFTNRAGRRPLTVADVERGPNVSGGPADGTWTVTAAKSDGITPGFTIRDAEGTRWFLKFDPPGHRGMATGTEVVVTRLVWALGYHVPENYLARLVPERLAIGPEARVTPPGEPERPMRLADITRLLDQADREPDGSYRVIASRALPGRPLGGFRFYGTRPDDPNDLVPHEHRRELRGLRVFAAWLNHVDAKAINTLDTLVTADGQARVRHHLIDFGSTLGSGGIGPREAWEGFEYLVQPRAVGRRLGVLGFRREPWRTVEMYSSPAIGTLPRDGSSFDPEAWRPRIPNPAFVRARADDTFWAARRLAHLTDGMIRAAVATGEFGDAEAERFLARALVERREAVLAAYLPAANPVIALALDASGLAFGNAAVEAGVAQPPAGYRAVWSRFDNRTREATRIGETTGRTAPLAAPPGLPTETGAYLRVEISAVEGTPEAWTRPVHAYFRRGTGGWTLIGFERQPG